MNNKESIRDELTDCVEKLIIDYDIDIELSDVENKINRLVDALTFNEDEDEEWDENEDFIQYRDDIDDFFGE